MNTKPRGCAAALVVLLALSGCASQPGLIAGDWQPALAACPGMRPLQPMPGLPSSAHLLLRIEFDEGRAVSNTSKVIKGIDERRAMRMAIAEVGGVMAQARCPGVRVLEVEAVIGPQQAGFRHPKTSP